MGKAVRIELDWRAVSPADLAAQLGVADLPAAQAARLDKKPRERWLMAIWLSSVAPSLGYPLRVHSSERPDFLVQFPGNAWGVECMEVVPEELKRLQSQLREVNSGWVRPVMAPGAHDWDWSNPLLQQLVEGKAMPGRVADAAPQSLWLSVMRWAVEKKRKVMRRPGFEWQPRNLLLLHDNWPLPDLLHDSGFGKETVACLQEALDGVGAFHDWQQVIIVQDQVIWTVNEQGVEASFRR